MGWLFMEKPRNVKAYFDNQFSHVSDDGTDYCVLDSAIVSFSTYYAACQITKSGQDPVVFCLICLLQFVPRAKDGMTFGYKDIDESMGPYQYTCPERILLLLTRPSNNNARVWREKCHTYIMNRRIVSGWPYGTLIKFPDSLEHYRKTDYPYSRQKNIFRNEITGKLARFRLDKLLTAQRI